MSDTIEQMREDGRNQTADSYSSAFTHFCSFANGREILLSDVDVEMVNSFSDYLRGQGMSVNSITYYIRALRAVYNRAVKLRLIKNCHPFEEVSTKVSEIKYTTLSAAQLHIIKTFDLSNNDSMAFARDMFLLSFYLRGMSYYDMAQLKKSNINNGAIVYQKRDEEDTLIIDLESVMTEIIDKYSSKTIGSEYLLPIITATKRDSDNFASAVRIMNIRLKKLAKLMNLDVSLTSAVARHSWATIALQKGLSKKLISRCLGYRNEYFSQKYLEGLENLVISNVNRMVIGNF